MPDKEIEQEAALRYEFTLSVADSAFLGDGWDVQSRPTIAEKFPQRVKVTVASTDLESALAVHPKDCVDDIIGVFGLLGIANTPILNLLELYETLLNAKLTLVLIELVHIVEEAGSPTILLLLCSTLYLTRKNFGHAHTNTIWADIARAENRLMLLV